MVCPRKSNSTKGKTYEEIYGIERAKNLREIRSISMKNRPSLLRGKTYEEILGIKPKTLDKLEVSQ